MCCCIFSHSTFPWSTTSSWRLGMFGKMKYRDTTSGPQSHPEDVEIWKPETAANGFFFNQESQSIFTWPSGGRDRQISDSEANLVYIVSSRLHSKTISTKQNQLVVGPSLVMAPFSWELIIIWLYQCKSLCFKRIVKQNPVSCSICDPWTWFGSHFSSVPQCKH